MGWVPAAEYPWLNGGIEFDGQVWFPEGAKSRIARIRRGKWVPIPAEWRCKTTHGSTIRKRNSKYAGKNRAKVDGYIVKGDVEQVPVQERKAPKVDDEW